MMSAVEPSDPRSCRTIDLIGKISETLYGANSPANLQPVWTPAQMEKSSIEFHYLKSNDFRTVHADGAFGGPTPQGGLFVSFYVERPPIPQRMKFVIEEDGRLQTEVEREGKSGMIREVDCGVSMSLATAKALKDWLESQIGLIESAHNQAAKSSTQVK